MANWHLRVCNVWTNLETVEHFFDCIKQIEYQLLFSFDLNTDADSETRFALNNKIIFFFNFPFIIFYYIFFQTKSNYQSEFRQNGELFVNLFGRSQSSKKIFSKIPLSLLIYLQCFCSWRCCCFVSVFLFTFWILHFYLFFDGETKRAMSTSIFVEADVLFVAAKMSTHSAREDVLRCSSKHFVLIWTARNCIKYAAILQTP